MNFMSRRPGAVTATIATAAVAALATIAALATRVAAHGLLTDAPQRGVLFGSEFAPDVTPVEGAPKDYHPHFPAGDKSGGLGAGRLSQLSVVNNYEGGIWTQFTPTKPGYVWKADVCGDPLWGKGAGDHMRGGRFYGDGTITRTYKAGGTLSMGMYMVAEHGGYTVLHVCDVAKCGGEVSRECFTNGHCKVLERAPEAESPGCAAGTRGDCAPVDPAHPERWYMPCPSTLNSPTRLGGDETAVFRLPPGLVCEHCVLHWYWVAANQCNPPGVTEYFTGASAPGWTASCTPAQGGYKPLIPKCGKEVPEEYLSCADIRIEGGGSGGSSGDADVVVTPTPVAQDVDSTQFIVPQTSASGPSEDTSTPSAASGGQLRMYVEGWEPFDVPMGTDGVSDVTVPTDARLTFEAIPSEAFPSSTVANFLIDGSHVWTERAAPYFLNGNDGDTPRYWPASDVIFERAFTLEVVVGKARFAARLRLWTA
ncbi:hypothetical protein MMPV_007854 [Pyropia vietnamensis]